MGLISNKIKGKKIINLQTGKPVKPTEIKPKKGVAPEWTNVGRLAYFYNPLYSQRWEVGYWDDEKKIVTHVNTHGEVVCQFPEYDRVGEAVEEKGNSIWLIEDWAEKDWEKTREEE